MTDRQAEEQTSPTSPEDGSWIRVSTQPDLAGQQRIGVKDGRNTNSADKVRPIPEETGLTPTSYQPEDRSKYLNELTEPEPTVFEEYEPTETPDSHVAYFAPDKSIIDALRAITTEERPVNPTRKLGLRKRSRDNTEIPGTREPDTLSQE